jgi:ribokinase
VRDRATGAEAARRLLGRGVRSAAAVQAGSEGNLLLTCEGEEIWLPQLPVRSIDATGAGDAFMGGLAVGVAEGQSWAETGWLANAAAALATTRVGAQAGMPLRTETLALIEKARSQGATLP